MEDGVGDRLPPAPSHHPLRADARRPVRLLGALRNSRSGQAGSRSSSTRSLDARAGMMRSDDHVVPVYPTLAASKWRRSLDWHRWFPFDVPGGAWTFSGRVALYHGLPHLDLPPHSVILVPNYHQGVEIDALVAAGYKLRYYRVGQQLEIDLCDVERRLDAEVSALYVIHYFGFPQPIARLRAFCDAHGLKLIEDCALSLFSRDGSQWLGSAGDLAIYSVYKTLPLPHGGFLITKEEQPAPALDGAPLRSTVVQTMDLINQTLRVTGWAGVERTITRTTRTLKRALRFNRTATIQSG